MAGKAQLDGRRVIVTGASAGTGEATVHAIAREGARVALAARVRTEYDAEPLLVPTDGPARRIELPSESSRAASSARRA